MATPLAERFQLDESCAPEIFQNEWQSNPDATALPFARDNPPFPLTAVDWHQLTLPDAEFQPHSWDQLSRLISANKLDELKRWPSSLKAYIAWTAHVKRRFGTATNYLLQQRLLWTSIGDCHDALKFEIHDQTPFADERDYKILWNDWLYALDAGIRHLVVWLKAPLPVDGEGALNQEGRKLVEHFIEKKFRTPVAEEKLGDKVIWFKNSTNLQSVRSLEHVHVLVRNVDDKWLEQWRK